MTLVWCMRRVNDRLRSPELIPTSRRWSTQSNDSRDISLVSAARSWYTNERLSNEYNLLQLMTASRTQLEVKVYH